MIVTVFHLGQRHSRGAGGSRLCRPLRHPRRRLQVPMAREWGQGMTQVQCENHSSLILKC